MAGFRIGGALPILPYMCPLNLSRGCFENMWSSTSTPLHVSTELFIKWLGWEYVRLYLHFPTCVHRDFFHVVVLRMFGALPPISYMCPLNLSPRWNENCLSSTSPPLYVSIKLSRCWVEKILSTASPQHLSKELFIARLSWEYAELYLHSPTCVRRTFYPVAGLRIGRALSPPHTNVHWTFYHVAG